MGGKEGDAHLDPAAEAFVHREPYGVGEAEHRGIVGFVGCGVVVVGEEGCVAWVLVVVLVLEVAGLEGVNDTGYGYELAWWNEF